MIPRIAPAQAAILATGFAVLFFGTGTRYVFGLALVPMTGDLDISRSVLSSALLLFMIVSALAMPIVGRLIDRYSIRLVMAVGAVISAAAIILTAFSATAWHIFALYGLLYAIGFSATSVAPVSVLMSRWFPNNTGLASSAAITGNGTGQLVIIALLASFLPAIGWRGAYLILGIINAAIVIPIVLIFVRSRPPISDEPTVPERAFYASCCAGAIAPPRPCDATPSHSMEKRLEPASAKAGDGGENSFPTIRAILATRNFWMLIAMYIICGFQDFFVATHVVAFAQDKGVGDLFAGNILAFMGLAGLTGVLLSGVLADRYGAVRPTIICFILRTAIFAYILFMQDPISIAAVALIYGFTFTITAPLTVVFARNIYGTAQLGSVSGLINMAHQIAGGLGALTGALIFDITGSYTGAFAVMFALSVIAAAATLAIREPRARDMV